MNAKLKKLLCVALSALLLVPALAACSTGDDPDDSKAETTGKTEVGTDPVDQTLNELKGKIDWKGEEFGILYNSGIGGSKEEMEAQAQFAGESSNAVINDAVFERNTLFQEYCNLKLVHLAVSAESYNNTLINGIQTGTRDFYLSSTSTGDTASSALQGYLYDYMKLDIDYNQIWWDAGTLNFALDGRVFFMNGPFNIVDDDVTYFFAFNKKLAQEHQLPDLYQRVRDLNWTMDYMNTVISNLSTDNGDGTWDDKDTYGLTATDVIAASFFYGAGLKYVENSRDMDTPQLMLDNNMDRALSVLDMARSIIHDNNSTYRGIGMTIFMQNRALFGYEVISYLRGLSSSMESGYGVLPVPMFDKTQGRYYAHSNPIGTTLSIPTSAAQGDMTRFGQTLELYAVLSQKLIRPAYYEVTLMTRNVQDLESTEMLEIILSSRVYDMAAYFVDLGLSGVFEEAVTGTSDNFSSNYSSVRRTFDKKVSNMLKKLQKMDK